MRNYRLEVFRRASLCRNFEEATFKHIKNNLIQFPVYLSAGQEYIPSSISTITENEYNPNIFIQHRGHSTYLAFGGNIIELIDELLGRKTGCANGMGGSASIQSKEKNIFGHDGLMGSQVPIAVGHCFITRKPTIVFCGDSAGEEDYVFSAIGWAATKKLPILFVIEDNNLSILTEKKVRRNWELDEVAKGFGVESFNISDDPIDIKKSMENTFKYPILLNINTVRKFWHAGAGIDNEDVFDRYLDEMESLGDEALKVHGQTKKLISELWDKQLEKQ